MEMQKPKVAAIYVRVSGDKQKKEATIESQIDAIYTYAKANNLQIIKEWIFKDEAETGKFLDRPGLDALRDLVRDGGPDYVIVHEPDRLMRRSAYQVLLIDEFEKEGVKVAFVKCKAAETPEEQLMLNMLGVFAEFEREKIVDRCRRGRLYKARMGKLSVIPCAPYGYNRNKKDNIFSFEIDPNKSNIVKEIFFLYTRSQYSLGSICDHLDAKGIPTPKNGKHWERSTIRDILKNETYIGTAYFGKTERCQGVPNRIVRSNGRKITKSRHSRKERPKDSWIPISVPGFITENDFEIAQNLLEANKKFSSRNTKELSLLQGLLVCKECGNPFYKKLRSTVEKGSTYYCCRSMLEKRLPKCGNRPLRQNELDSLVWNEVVQLLKDPSLLEQEIARRIKENTQGLDKHLNHEIIQKEFAQLSTAKDKLLDAYQYGNCLTLDELRNRMEKITKRTNELEIDLKALNELKEQNENSINIQETLKYFEKKLTASSSDLSVEDKQKVIRLLIEEVVIGKESIKIKHCIPTHVGAIQNSPLRSVRFMKA